MIKCCDFGGQFLGGLFFGLVAARKAFEKSGLEPTHLVGLEGL